LTLAFIRPVTGENYVEESIAALRKVETNMDKVYGACADERMSLNVFAGEGSCQQLLDFAAGE
jgi:CRISPR system Cascade subunit CasC